MPESGGCTLTTVPRLQIECTALQHWQDGERRREKQCLLSYLCPPWLGMISLEPGRAWVSLLNWGWLTQSGRVPLVDPFKGLLSPTFWLAPESHVASRPQGIWRQGSASIHFWWACSQFRAHSWECSLLDPYATSAVDRETEKDVRTGCLCDA